jgi:hypothetical protein
MVSILRTDGISAQLARARAKRKFINSFHAQIISLAEVGQHVRKSHG